MGNPRPRVYASAAKNELEAPISLRMYRTLDSISMSCIKDARPAFNLEAGNSTFMNNSEAEQVRVNTASSQTLQQVRNHFRQVARSTTEVVSTERARSSRLQTSRPQQASSGGAQREARDVAAGFKWGWKYHQTRGFQQNLITEQQKNGLESCAP